MKCLMNLIMITGDINLSTKWSRHSGKKWNRDFFHTLIIRQKWHVKTRNVKIGDIVLVQDTNSLKGKWKLAQVIETFVGSDNIVRNVTIRYKLNKPGMNYNGQADSTVNRSVHSLVIILPVEEQ